MVGAIVFPLNNFLEWDIAITGTMGYTNSWFCLNNDFPWDNIHTQLSCITGTMDRAIIQRSGHCSVQQYLAVSHAKTLFYQTMAWYGIELAITVVTFHNYAHVTFSGLPSAIEKLHPSIFNHSPDADDTDLIFGHYLMTPGADYPPPVEGASGQIGGRPLSQSTRSVCYDQRTYQDDEEESDESFTLQIIADRRYALDNLVIDEARGSTQVKIIDDDDGELCGAHW